MNLDKEKLSRILSSLSSENVLARLHALDELVDLGPLAMQALPHLIDLLDDEDPDVAESAAGVIANVGPPASEAVPILLQHVDDRRASRVRLNRQFRLTVHAALEAIGTTAFTTMRDHLIAHSDQVSDGFKECFCDFGRTCFDELTLLLHHEDPRVRVVVVEAISSCDDGHRREAMKLLVAALEDPAQSVAGQAARALRQEVFFRRREVGPPLRKAARQGVPRVRAFALNMLERFEPHKFKEEHRKLLAKLRQDHPPVPLPSDVFDLLQLNHWNRLSASSRARTLSAINDAFKRAGFDFCDAAIHRYGPKSDSQPIAYWRDSNGLRFVLVPGGSFKLGYDEEQVKILERIITQLEGPDCKIRPARVPIFNSGDCNVCQRKEVRVPPMIIAAELVRDVASSDFLQSQSCLSIAHRS